MRTRPADAPAPRRRARLPRPLAALLAVVALFGVGWALITPAWQSPDEDVHFAYVQSLVERHARPGDGPGAVSTAQYESMQATNTDATVFLTIARPPWSRTAHERWLKRTARASQSDGGGANAASGYPPAYYLAETVGYALAAPHANVLTHLYAARLFSVVFLLLTTAGVWLLAGELTGRRRDLQLLAAGCVGLWPMLEFMSASVNPDALLYASWTWTLWLGVRMLRSRITAANAVALCGCAIVAVATKSTSLALLPAVGFALVFSLWRRVRGRGFAGRRVGATAGIALALAVALMVVAGPRIAEHLTSQASFVHSAGRSNVREFLSYVWQFYLPRLPFQHPVSFSLPTISSYPAYNVWVATGWAAFGWVTVFFPRGVYGWFLAITVLVAIAAVGRGVRLVVSNRRTAAIRAVVVPVGAFLGLAALVLVVGLHYTEYKLRSPTLQGRYLFPLSALGGLAVALAATWLPQRARAYAVGAVLGALVLFELSCLGLVAQHYYG